MILEPLKQENINLINRESSSISEVSKQKLNKNNNYIVWMAIKNNAFRIAEVRKKKYNRINFLKLVFFKPLRHPGSQEMKVCIVNPDPSKIVRE